MNKYLLFASILLGLVWSCSDSELFTPGDEYLPGLNKGAYQVNMNGALSNFSKFTEAISSVNGSEINGNSADGNMISISLPQKLSNGTYYETDGAMVTIVTDNGIFTNMDSAGTLLPFQLDITSVNNSAGLVSGKFSGNVANLLTGESVALTEGIFNLIEFDPSLPQTQWKLTAKFSGEAFDFSQNAKAEGVATAAIITGDNLTQAQTLTLKVPGGISVKTFTEEDHASVEVNLGSSENPSDVYTSYDPLTETYLPIKINITSVSIGDEETPGIVHGTFSGMIAKFSNGVPIDQVTITDGKIVVPIVL